MGLRFGSGLKPKPKDQTYALKNTQSFKFGFEF